MTRTVPTPDLTRWLWRAVVVAAVIAGLQPVWAAVLLVLLTWIGAAALLTWHRRRVWVLVAVVAAGTAVLALGAPGQPSLVFAAPVGLVVGWLDVFLSRTAKTPVPREELADRAALVDE